MLERHAVAIEPQVYPRFPVGPDLRSARASLPPLTEPLVLSVWHSRPVIDHTRNQRRDWRCNALCADVRISSAGWFQC